MGDMPPSGDDWPGCTFILSFVREIDDRRRLLMFADVSAREGSGVGTP
jgi:hypothetical protein